MVFVYNLCDHQTARVSGSSCVMIDRNDVQNYENKTQAVSKLRFQLVPDEMRSFTHNPCCIFLIHLDKMQLIACLYLTYVTGTQLI